MSIKLSICIPTFNRVEFIKETIQSILSQITEEVEIVVSDNASNDNTEEIILEYKMQFPQITYFRWEKNVGMDRNFLKVIELARGEYCWWLGSDDILLPGSVENLLRIINQYNKQLIFIHANNKPFINDVNNLSNNNSLSLSKDLITKDENIILEQLGIWITYLSGSIIKRNLLLNIKSKAEKFLGTLFLHSYFILEIMAISAPKLMVVTKDAFIANRADNTGGYNFFKIFIRGYYELLMYAVSLGYNKAIVKKLLKSHLEKYVLRMIVLFKVKSAFGSLKPNYVDGFIFLLQVYKLNLFLWFVIIPILLCPNFVFVSLYNFKTVIRKIKYE